MNPNIKEIVIAILFSIFYLLVVDYIFKAYNCQKINKNINQIKYEIQY